MTPRLACKHNMICLLRTLHTARRTKGGPFCVANQSKQISKLEAPNLREGHDALDQFGRELFAHIAARHLGE